MLLSIAALEWDPCSSKLSIALYTALLRASMGFTDGLAPFLMDLAPLGGLWATLFGEAAGAARTGSRKEPFAMVTVSLESMSLASPLHSASQVRVCSLSHSYTPMPAAPYLRHSSISAGRPYFQEQRSRTSRPSLPPLGLIARVDLLQALARE